MASAPEIDFRSLIPEVAQRLFDNLNPRMSKADEMRFGSKGSLSIDLLKGTFYDHETGQGGGCLDLIIYKRGGDTPAAMSWLGSEGLIDTQSQAMHPSSTDRQASIFYDYADEHGEIRYRVERIGRGAEHDFRQHGPDGRGGFRSVKGCMAGVEPLPYRLPELLDADRQALVYICEGEKDVDRLISLGLIATTNSGGGGKWRTELNRWLAGRRCVLLEDNDRVGREHVAKVKAELVGIASELAVLKLPELSEKGDVSDWLDAGHDVDELQALARKALQDGGPEMLDVIDAGDFDGEDIPPREWMLEGWEPKNTCVLLTGLGATGKSLLTQQRMTCSAAGLPFMGLDVRPGVSLYITCEDDRQEIHRRQASINASLGIRWSDLRGRLKLVSLKGVLNKELATFDAEGRMRVTDRWKSLVASIEHVGATHVALDNVAHFFTGNENIRNQVAAFVGLLDGLAEQIGGGVLLLGHPNKAGAEYSGSTAWENQVRARLYLSHDKDEGGATNPDARILTNSKPNYSRRGEEIRFLWHQWAFIREDDLPPHIAEELSVVAADNAHSERFLACLRQRTKERRAVSDRPSSTYAPKVFASMPEAKGSSKNDLTRAMDRLFRIGQIERGELWKGDDRKPVTGLRETAGDRSADHQKTAETLAGDRAGDCAGDVRETAGNHSRETAGNVRETSPHTPIGAGGPTDAAPPAPERTDLRSPIFAPGDEEDAPFDRGG